MHTAVQIELVIVGEGVEQNTVSGCQRYQQIQLHIVLTAADTKPNPGVLADDINNFGGYSLVNGTV